MNGVLQKDNNDLQKEMAELEKELRDCKISFDLANKGLKTQINEFERASEENKNRIAALEQERDDLISR